MLFNVIQVPRWAIDGHKWLGPELDVVTAIADQVDVAIQLQILVAIEFTVIVINCARN
jgi:hypothetical protein